MFKRLLSIFRLMRLRQGFEDNMSEELQFHLQQATEELIRSGMNAEQAARQARMELGSINSVTEECRRSRSLHIGDELLREARYAVRALRKSPWFTVTALLTLGVCLGANLTIFAVVDSILLRPLPFPEANRLVTMFNTYPKAGVDRDGSSITNYYERRGQLHAFRSLAIYRYGTALIGKAGFAKREEIMQVSPDFFTTLGRGPVIGRSFREEEITAGADSVAILTDAIWRRSFHADPHVIGHKIFMDGVPKTIVGVLPPTFRFLSSNARIFVPLASVPEQRTPKDRHSGGNTIQMIARLNAGSTAAQAQAELDSQNSRLELNDPQAKMIADAGFRTMVVALHADHVAAIRPTLLLLQAGVFGLLLIGIVNLLNLFLVRINARSRELAVRRALGASAGRLFGEVSVETLLITVGGGLLGLPAAIAGIRLLSVLGADRLPLGSQIAFNGELAVLAVAAAVVLGLLLAAPITWFHSRAPLLLAIQSESRTGTASHSVQRLRQIFIVAQIALAFVLLAGSGLLGLSLRNASQVAPGFRATHLVTGSISLPNQGYPSSQVALMFTERLMEKMAQQPGVTAAGISTNIPLSGSSGKSAATIKGYIRRPGESPRGNYSYGVDGDYFGAMGYELKAGRFLTAADSRGTDRVCVVDEDFAHYYWPQTSAIGHQLFQGSEAGPIAEAFTIVGVVGRVRQAGLTDEGTQGAVYYPFRDRADPNMFVVLRSSLPVHSSVPLLQRVVHQVDSSLAVSDLQSMDTRIADSLIVNRSPVFLAGFFSGIALLLTAVGTYGVLSYSVAQRRREIGVRMALGAEPRQIGLQFLSLALQLFLCGAMLGVSGAWLAGEAMKTWLFHVPAIHFPTLAASAAILGVVALIACLLPSYRAARISPLETLASQ